MSDKVNILRLMKPSIAGVKSKGLISDYLEESRRD